MKHVTITILAFVLSVLPSTAADMDSAATMPHPQVTVNTNSIVQIAKVWQSIESPGAFFGALKDSLEVQGVYSWTSNNGGQSGAGSAAQLVIASITLDAIKVNLGPAYVVGVDHDSDIFQGVELAATARFLPVKMDAIWKDVPILGALPISWDAATMYVGAGAAISGPASWQPTGFMVSVGLGGITWGKGK